MSMPAAVDKRILGHLPLSKQQLLVPGGPGPQLVSSIPAVSREGRFAAARTRVVRKIGEGWPGGLRE